MAQSRFHVAIIMDGNGRWAIGRDLPRVAGHQAGAEALRTIVESAPTLGITMLTVYAFSSDNWKRPPVEVSALMHLLALFLAEEAPRCVANGIRLSVIGRRDRLDPMLVEAIGKAERETIAGSAMHLRVAVDYSARAAIKAGYIDDTAGVDLLIRTGGEQRLSDFLLWESAYAELYFTPVMWPDFSPQQLRVALQQFSRRQRRFGAVGIAPPIPLPATERWLR